MGVPVNPSMLFSPRLSSCWELLPHGATISYRKSQVWACSLSSEKNFVSSLHRAQSMPSPPWPVTPVERSCHEMVSQEVTVLYWAINTVYVLDQKIRKDLPNLSMFGMCWSRIGEEDSESWGAPLFPMIRLCPVLSNPLCPLLPLPGSVPTVFYFSHSKVSRGFFTINANIIT